MSRRISSRLKNTTKVRKRAFELSKESFEVLIIPYSKGAMIGAGVGLIAGAISGGLIGCLLVPGWFESI